MRRIDAALFIVLLAAGSGLGAGRAVAQCVEYDGFMHRTGHLQNPGVIADAVAVGDLYYLADRDLGIRVIDATDPGAPALVAELPVPGTMQTLVAAGPWLVLATGDAGLQIVDISIPTAPTLAGAVATGLFAFDVAVVGDHAYVAAGSDDLVIVDISDPLAPQVVGNLATPGFPLAVAAGVDCVYLADGFSGLRTYSLDDPANPVLTDVVESTGNITHLAADGDRLVALDNAAGCRLMDISIPAQPLALEVFGSATIATDLELAGGLAYVARGDYGLWIQDVSGTSAELLAEYGISQALSTVAPRPDGAFLLVDTWDILLVEGADHEFVGPVSAVLPDVAALDLAVNSDVAYVVAWDAMQVVDVSDPTALAPRGRVEGLNSSRTLAALGSTVMVAQDNDDLLIVDASDPDLPVVAASLEELRRAEGLAAANGRGYVVSDLAGLSILDLSDPTAPVVLGQAALDYTGRCLGVSGATACIGHGDGVDLWDVSDSANPIRVGGLEAPGVNYLGVHDDLLCFSTVNPRMLRIVDITDPSAPVELAAVPALNHAYSFAFDGPWLYVGIYSDASDMLLYDLTDPAAPRLAGEAQSTVGNFAMALVGDYLLEGGYDGLATLPAQCEDTTTAVEPIPTSTPLSLHARPNPFNPRTSIAFVLPATASVRLGVYDLAGRRVRVLLNDEHLPSGPHAIAWDGRDQAGRELASGVYCCLFEAGAVRSTTRLTLVR